jgi:hypothetical protein
MHNFRVDVAFSVEASSPAMAMRKLMNALGASLGEQYIEALNASVGIGPGGTEIPVDTTVAMDDPRLIAGAYIGVADVKRNDDSNAFHDVAQF